MRAWRELNPLYRVCETYLSTDSAHAQKQLREAGETGSPTSLPISNFTTVLIRRKRKIYEL